MNLDNVVARYTNWEEDKTSSSLIMDDETEVDENVGVDEAFRKDGSWYFQNQKVMLTYKTWVDKNLMENFILGLMNGKKPKFIRTAHETGHQNTPYKHSHVVIDFGYRFQTRNCNLFDIEGCAGQKIHPNIKFSRTAKHWKNWMKYLAKEDQDNADLLELVDTVPLVKQIWNCETLSDALMSHGKSTKDFTGIVTAWGLRPNGIGETTIPPFYNWCADVESLILQKKNFGYNNITVVNEGYNVGHFNEKGDWIRGTNATPVGEIPSLYNRTINLVWDPKGRNGKTTFLLSMEKKYPGSVLIMQGLGSYRDISTNIIGAIERGWNGKTVLINLTRQTADHKSIYQSLEALADGFVTSQKYSGKSITFSIENIWVFSNFMTKLDAVSQDRWRLWTIRDDNTLDKISLSEGWETYHKERDERKEENFSSSFGLQAM